MTLLEHNRHNLERARAEREQALENFHAASEAFDSVRTEYWQSKEYHDGRVSRRDSINVELSDTRKEIANLEKSLSRAKIRLSELDETAKRVIRPEASHAGKRLDEVLAQYGWAQKQVDNSKRAAILATERVKSAQIAYRNAGGKLSREEMLVDRNPWKTGSFYLVAFLLILCVVGFIAIKLPWYVVGTVIIGSLFALSIVGALQFRQDDLLSEENFIQLMIETFKALPLLNKGTTESKADVTHGKPRDSESTQDK